MTDLNKCPGCGGPADNGHDREYPPSPYYCTKCEARAEEEYKEEYAKELATEERRMLEEQAMAEHLEQHPHG